MFHHSADFFPTQRKDDIKVNIKIHNLKFRSRHFSVLKKFASMWFIMGPFIIGPITWPLHESVYISLVCQGKDSC